MFRLIPLAVAILLAGAATADAHALLQKASPAVGSTVTAPPPELWLRFSEGVEPAFCTIAVRNTAGADFVAGKPHTAPDNARQLLVGLKPLPPGDYAVEWHATSVDTHKTEGSYHFTVSK